MQQIGSYHSIVSVIKEGPLPGVSSLVKDTSDLALSTTLFAPVDLCQLLSLHAPAINV
jgi:hypothetical protein